MNQTPAIRPRTRVRAVAALATALLACCAALPDGAAAHGLVGRTDLPIPQWLFAWVAAIVLIVSFVALATLWTRPQLRERRLRRLFGVPRWVEPLCGVLGVAAFAVVVYAGLAGTAVPTANLAPTMIYVIFWVATPLLSVLLGDVFRPLNPWRAVARGAARLLPGRSAPLHYPDRLGRWPAVVGVVGFAWLELVFVNRDDPQLLAVLALAYAGVQLAGMAAFGIETWCARADAFGVYFNLFSRLSAFEARDGAIYTRRLLSGVVDLEMVPGTVALLAAIIGATTFDGASNGIWTEIGPQLATWIGDLGFGGDAPIELAGSIGLAACIVIVGSFYRLGIAGMRSVDPRRDAATLARQFAHTLTPIAFAYLLAHYFSLLAYQGQALIYLASDPLGQGSNLFGTATVQIDYALVSAASIWYVQVGALVAGHVAGLALAHDSALTIFRRGRTAARSQYWMLVVMVGFTCLGLWLLSAVNH